ncbi:MAG: hypothetical protein FWG31_07105 [Oscillospiraceae bacterium]|nr:hypothetical protein [Oscillospiraceae bacterium]
MKERVKTAAIILLGLSALWLLWRNWVVGSVFTGRDGIDPPIQYAPARRDYTPSAAVPFKCAVMLDGTRTGAQYGGETEAVYEVYKPILTEAFGSARSPAVLGEAAFWEELSLDGVFFEFSAPFPLSLLAAWLSADNPGGGDAVGVGLSFAEGGVRLFWIDGSGACYRAETAMSAEQPELPGLPPCLFAFESESGEGLNPLQLLIEEPLPRPVLTVSPLPGYDDPAYIPFLEALEFFPQETPFYMREETKVYVDVDNGRSCELSPGGLIVFTGSDNGASADQSIAADALVAWEAISLLEPITGLARFSISRMSQTDGTTVIEYMLTAGGVPLLLEPAVVEIEGGVIRKMTLRLFHLSAGEDGFIPLPLQQALELVPENHRLELRYSLHDNGMMRADWAVGS